MKPLILVALGGALGAVSRFIVSGWVLRFSTNLLFPLPTFIVNVAGCLLAGILAGCGERFNVLTPDVRLLLFTGLLGGFTTFSAFGVETIFLIRRGEWTIAFGYSLASVVIGCGAMGLAYAATKSPTP